MRPLSIREAPSDRRIRRALPPAPEEWNRHIRTNDHDSEVKATLDGLAMNLLRQTGEPQTLVVILTVSQSNQHTTAR